MDRVRKATSVTLLLLFHGGVAVDTVVPNEATHANTTDASAITTTTDVGPQEALHANTTDSPIIIGVFVVPNETLHAQTADQAVIIRVISPAETRHVNTTDASTVTSPTVISPAETRHGHTADSPGVLGDVIPGAIEVEFISPTMYVEIVTHDMDGELIHAGTTMEVFDQ